MGQLIKLQDYVSRYEQDIFFYPSRFVWLKKQQWEKLKRTWEENQYFSLQTPSWIEVQEEEEKSRFFQRIKEKWQKKQVAAEPETQAAMKEDDLQLSISLAYRPDSLTELKQQFLDQLLRFQMKWASSTLFEKSYLNRTFFYDERLRYFLQRFPDTYLLFYQPVFLLKKAPVEAEAILISPTEVWCLSFIEAEDDSVFIGSKEHFWEKRFRDDNKKVLNPVVALSRTEMIVKEIFKQHQIELPVYKAVISRNGYIDYPSPPYQLQLIERRNYQEWFQRMRNLRSPLKHLQLKGAHALLQYCQTTSIQRLEWEETK
ncbi:NERD domain-containing protein [Bacillaceae bacterium Marseille-Q3522]|nr:NERD domain-containing protein [Bacillaceae bacterium Marseille-Q3522]